MGLNDCTCVQVGLSVTKSPTVNLSPQLERYFRDGAGSCEGESWKVCCVSDCRSGPGNHVADHYLARSALWRSPRSHFVRRMA